MEHAFFFFIIGTAGHERRVDGGVTVTRECPSCNGPAHLDEHQTVYYFTLFFLPLFPVRKGDRYLKCRACETAYALTEEARRATDDEFEERTAADLEPQSDLDSSSFRVDESDDEDLVEWNCLRCPGKLLVPNTGKRMRVTCPHCDARFEVRDLSSAAEVEGEHA